MYLTYLDISDLDGGEEVFWELDWHFENHSAAVQQSSNVLYKTIKLAVSLGHGLSARVELIMVFQCCPCPTSNFIGIILFISESCIEYPIVGQRNRGGLTKEPLLRYEQVVLVVCGHMEGFTSSATNILEPSLAAQ